MMLIMAPRANAALGSKGLILNNGREITLKKGEKQWVMVRDGFTGLPCWKGLKYYSDNPLVFSVNLKSGILRGNGAGCANLTVVDQKGNCGYALVRVEGSEKLNLAWMLWLVPILILWLVCKKLKDLLNHQQSKKRGGK